MKSLYARCNPDSMSLAVLLDEFLLTSTAVVLIQSTRVLLRQRTTKHLIDYGVLEVQVYFQVSTSHHHDGSHLSFERQVLGQRRRTPPHRTEVLELSKHSIPHRVQLEVWHSGALGDWVKPQLRTDQGSPPSRYKDSLKWARGGRSIQYHYFVSDATCLPAR